MTRGNTRLPRAAAGPMLAAAAMVAVLAGALLARDAAAGRPADSGTWPQNGSGYAWALRVSRAERRPMFVYFRTDWCPYCREFERQLLGAEQVETHLRTLARVRINPEVGDSENRLAETYGVTGYPAIFVQRTPSDPPRRLSRTVRGANGEPRLKTPVEFLASLREAAGN